MPKRTPRSRRGKDDHDSPDLLSRRELQVLRLIADGHTSGEAATLLGLSPKSIDTYRSRIMVKLDIANLPGLVKFAIRHGITTLDYRAPALAGTASRRGRNQR